MVRVTPFEVDAEEIERLGSRFTEFMNKLLSAECARVKLDGPSLQIDVHDSTADGGVDALIVNSETGTRWLLSGSCIWQFKRSDLPPAKCRKEIQDATWVHQRIRDGSRYRLAIGASLGDRKVQERLKALRGQAEELGLPVNDHTFGIVHAAQLAQWASEFPAIAQLQVLGGPATGVKGTTEWGQSRTHQSQWSDAVTRRQLLSQIRNGLEDPEVRQMRIQGAQGIGKSRLALEALKNSSTLSHLAVYIPSADDAEPQVVQHLCNHTKSAIVVVDECDNRQHAKIYEQISESADTKLLSIGQHSAHTLSRSVPIIVPESFSESDAENLIRSNFPNIWPEAEQFIVRYASGNPRWINLMCEAISVRGIDGIDQLIADGDIEEFIRRLSPHGSDFFLAAILALFDRVGWDREKRQQLEVLAQFAEVSTTELQSVGYRLESNGLMTRQGRYRSIGPLPFAVGLAASAWRQNGRRILDELLPQLDDEHAESMFKRLSELGTYEPARVELENLLTSDSSFGTLESIENHGIRRFFVHLAIVAPERTLDHLELLLSRASTEELRTRIALRRDLVRTLEKLAWNTATFVRAAELILQLALAENEAYSNNASGLWSSLFSPQLPATSAKPDLRLDYLRRVASRGPVEKLRVVAACVENMRPGGAVMVSGEVQGGRVVEPRGSVRSRGDYESFRAALVSILEMLSDDPHNSVAESAFEALVKCVPLLIDNSTLGPEFRRMVLRMPHARQIEFRREIVKWSEVGRRAGSGTAAAVSRLIEELPPPDSLERVQDLGALHPWDYRESDISSDIRYHVLNVVESGHRNDLLVWLATSNQPNRWRVAQEIGRLSEITAADMLLLSGDLPTITGALQGRLDSGEEAVFETFFQLDDQLGVLDDDEKLQVAVRAPASESTRTRVSDLVAKLPPSKSISALTIWRRQLSAAEFLSLATSLRSMITDQLDYNSVVDWLHLTEDEHTAHDDSFISEVWQVVELRSTYPEVGRQEYAWSRLAERFVDTRPVDLVRLVLDLLNSDSIMLHEDDHESHVFARAVANSTDSTWPIIGNEIVQGSWRVSMSLRFWLTRSTPLQPIATWVGQDAERARAVSTIAHVQTGDDISEISQYLLANFGDDEFVKSTLAGAYLSGSWVGRWSERLRKQIDEVEAWVALHQGEDTLTGWCRGLLLDLRSQLPQTLEREEERGY